MDSMINKTIKALKENQFDAYYAECVAKAKELRAEFDVGMYERPKKLGKLLGRLENEGYWGALINPTEEIKVFEK